MIAPKTAKKKIRSSDRWTAARAASAEVTLNGLQLLPGPPGVRFEPGLRRIVWTLLVMAGPDGVDMCDLLAATTSARGWEINWATMKSALADIRMLVWRAGITLETQVAGRWGSETPSRIQQPEAARLVMAEWPEAIEHWQQTATEAVKAPGKPRLDQRHMPMLVVAEDPSISKPNRSLGIFPAAHAERLAERLIERAKTAASSGADAERTEIVASSFWVKAAMVLTMTRPFSDFEISPTSPRPDCRVSAEQWAADGHPVTFGRGPTRYGNSVFATVAEG